MSFVCSHPCESGVSAALAPSSYGGVSLDERWHRYQCLLRTQSHVRDEIRA